MLLDWAKDFLEVLWDGVERAGLDKWEAWVAIGTLSLAAVTGFLARRTSEQVKATLSEVGVAREALQTQVRPVLADVPRGVHYGQREDIPRAGLGDVDLWIDTDVMISVPVRNSGNGLAIIKRVSLQTDAIRGGWGGRAKHTVLPPGDFTRLDYVIAADSSDVAARMRANLEVDGVDLWASVEYSDVNGQQVTRTELQVRYHDDLGGYWRVDGLSLYNQGEGFPFTSAIGVSDFGDFD